MSRGKNLQEMEVGTKQSKSAVKDPAATLKSVNDVVNSKAKAAEAMQTMAVKEEAEEEEEIDEDELSEEQEDDEDLEDYSDDEDDDEDEEDEEDEELEEEFDIEEDVQALVEGEDLSEEFKDKAKVIFEAALRSKVNEIREVLDEQYQQAYEERLYEEVGSMKEELQERVDSYLEYVADEWMQENNLAIEYGIKEQLSESFLSNLKNLFEDHYVQLPEEKYDVLENMVEKLDEMETKLNEQIERNIQLNRRLSESVADRIFDVVSDGLAITQKEKLASLAESVEFESEEEYREKLETLKESYFPSRTTSPTAQPETLSEGVISSVEDYSPSMNTYMKALSMLANN